MLVGNRTLRSAATGNALVRSLRLGVSATSLILAGAALSPAFAQVTRDLGGATVNGTGFGAFTVYTNGTFQNTVDIGETYAGAMNDSGGVFALTKLGTGTLSLTGTGMNSYSGQTTVSAGILQAGAANVFSGNSLLRINGGSVDLNGFSQSVAGLSGNGALGNGGAAAVLTLTGSAGTQTSSGTISGDIRIVKDGANTQNFSGINTFTGGIDVSGGQLGFGSNQAFGAGVVNFTGASTLAPTINGRVINNAIILGAAVNYAGGTSTLSGVITGGGLLTKLGNGLLTISNAANDFTGGINLNAGSLGFATNSLGTGNITTSAAQVTLSTQNSFASITNNIVLGGQVNFELPDGAGGIALAGTISGGGGLYLKTGTGTLILSGDNSYAGNTLVDSGTLGLQRNTAAAASTIVVSGTALGLAAYGADLDVANNIRSRVITGVDTRGFDLTLSGVLSNVSGVNIGGLDKRGEGTLTLTRANTYTGATTVSAGRLNVNNSLVSAVTVNNGGTLGGIGTIANSVTVAAGGHIAPGTSPGTLTVNSLVLDAGSFLDFELANPAQIGNGVNDLIIVNTNLTLAGTVNVSALPGFVEGTYRIINYGGVLNNIGLVIGTTPNDFSLTVDTATTGQVNLIATFSGTRYWDGSGPFGNNTVDGGTGTWDASSTNWTGVTGMSQVAWTGNTGIFAGTAGIVTLSGVQSFSNLDFQTAGYTLTGSNLAINNSVINTSAAGVTTINSIISGANGLTKNGTGTLALNAANNFIGGLTVNAGTVRLGTNNGFGNGTVTLAAGTTLQGTTGVDPDNGNRIILGGAVSFDANGGGTTLNGMISGNGPLTIFDVGPANITTGFVLGNANNIFTGAISVTNTLLGAATNASLGALANTLSLNNAIFAGLSTITTARTITLTNSGTLLVQPGLMLTANGAIGGTGSLVKDGAGTLVLGNAGNNYAGGTVIRNGTVSIASDGALGAPAGAISFGGTTLQPPQAPTTLRFTASVNSARNVSIATGSTGVINTVGNQVALSGNITGAGTLAKTGVGTLVLSGSNDYNGGTSLNAGTLTVAAGNNLGGGTLTAAAGTTLRVGTSGGQTIMVGNNIVANGVLTIGLGGTIGGSPALVPATGLLITDGNAVTLSGTITGAGRLVTDANAPGNLTLMAANDYAGGTAINRASVSIGAATSLGSGNVTLDVGGILNRSGMALSIANNVGSNGFGWAGGSTDLTLVGALSGNGTFFKVGSDTLTLASAGNNFSGLIDVVVGRLNVNGALTDGAGTVTVRDGASLSGAGSIAGTVNVAAAATLAPGDSSGPLTIGTLNLVDNALLSYQLGAANTIAGPFNDQVIVTGNLQLGGRLTVAQSAGGNFAPGVYNLFTYGTLNGNGVAIDSLANGLNGIVQINTNARQVNLLVLGAGPLFQYWDGTDVIGNGTIDGNTGIWNTTDFNWTGTTDNDTVLPSAFLNTTWQTGSVAIFRGTAGTVSLATNFTPAGLEFQTNGYLLTGGGLTVAAGGMFVQTNMGVTATINSPLTGGGRLTKRGAGTLILSGNNDYSGGTALNAGTIAVTNSASLGSGPLAMANTTTLLALAPNITLSNAIGITGTGTVDTNGNTFTLDGIISGGTLTKVSAGTLILTRDNLYMGGTNLAAGTIQINRSQSLGTGTLTMATGTTLLAGAPNLSLANAIFINGFGTVDTNGNTLTLANTVSGNTLVKAGAGTLVLNVANDYTGGTNLNTGTIQVNNSNALGSGTLTMADGTTLVAGGPDLNVGNAITLGGSATIDTGAFLFATPGTISGGGPLIKIGSGVLFLAGNNDYTGGTNVEAGTVVVYNSASAGSGTIALANGTQLATAGGTFTTPNAITITGAASLLTQGAGDLWTLSGVIADGGAAGTLIKNGPGTLILTNANTYSGGTNLNAGTIQVANNGALGTGSLAMADGTILQAGMNGVTTGNAIAVTGTGTIDTQNFGYTISGQISGGAITKTGTGTLTLANANTYTGGTSISAGRVAITNNLSLGSGTVAMANGTTLQSAAADLVVANAFTLTGTDTIDTQGFTLTLGGVLSGTGGVTKIGSGTLTLTNTSIYTGATAVNAGNLKINGSLAGSAVTVASGATLSGTGSVAGSVTILDGGNLTPGNGAGTFTVGSLTLNNASNVNFELGAANTSGSAFNDLVIVNGNLVLDGLLNVSESAGGNFTTGIYEIFRYSGTLTDNILDLGGPLPNGRFGVVQAGLVPGQVNLIVTQAPGLLLYWDGADGIGNGVISGGSGTWSALSTNWTGAPPSAFNTNWQNTIGVFQGTAGVVTIAGPQAFEMLQFAVDGYTLNAGANGSLTTAGASILFAATDTNAVINAPITGAGSIGKQGFGTITLNGDNSYAGGTDLMLGTITVGANTALGTGTLAMAGGTVLRSGANNLILANAITTAGVGTVDTNGNQLTLSGVIGGAGSISKIGAGNLTLSGNNGFNGLNIAAGSVTASTSNNALGIGTVSLADGTTLFIGSNALTIANNIALAAGGETIDVLGNSVTLGGTISGAGRLTYTDTLPGSGDVITITGTNSYTGGTSVVNTTIAINADAALGAATGDLALTNAAVRTGASFASGRAVSLTGTGTFGVAGGTVLTLNGVVSGSGQLVTNGAGTLVLNGNNSYVGGTNHTGGTIVIGSNTALGSGTFSYNGEGTRLVSGVDNLVVANNFVLNANNTLNNPFDTQAFTTRLTGAISGAGAFTKLGTGTLILTGDNSYAGGTSLTAGTIAVGSNTAVGTGVLTTQAGTTLQAFANNVALLNAIATSAGTQTVDTQGFSFTLNGAIGGAGTISKIGSGTLILNGNNSYTGGTNLTAGTITVGANTALGTGTLAMAGGTVLAAGVSGLSLANAITTAGVGTVNQGMGVFTLNGNIAGAGSIVTVNTGNLILNGNNSFTNLAIGAGTVTLGSNTAAGSGAIAMADNTTLAAGVSGLVIANTITTAGTGTINQGAGSFTLNGQISGPGSISATGTGNLVLNGNNLFTNLIVGNGTVSLGSNTAAGIGSITLATNTTLAAGVSGLVVANNIITAGIGTINQGSGSFTLNGLISGPGSLSATGTGNLVLNGSNLFTNLNIGNGTVTVGSNTAAGIGSITLGANTTLAAGVSGLVLANDIITAANGIINQGTGSFTLNGLISGPGSISATGAGNLVLNGNNLFTNLVIGNGTVTVGSNTAAGIGSISLANNTTLAAGVSGLVLANSITTAGVGVINQGVGTLTLNGLISGPGSISATGAGNLVLNGSNLFTNLNISNGTVTVGSNTAAGIGSITLAANTTLAAGVSGLVLANNITTAGSGSINQGTGTFTLNGQISGAGSISTTNTGNLILNGNNLFTNLIIGNGTVTVGSNTAAGIGSIALATNTTLAAGANNLVLTNNVQTAGIGTIDTGANILTLSGVISGAGSLIKVGTGTLNLTAANTYIGGTVINAGTIGFTTAAAFGTGTITVNSGTLQANSNGLTLTNLINFAGAGSINTQANALTISSVISGSGGITKLGTGTLTLTGANSFTGGTTISAGTLVGSVATLGSGGILNNAALVFDQAIDASFNQVISGTGSITKQGAGALTIASVNTVTGPTTVTAGRLNVTGSLASSAVTLQTGTSLTGTGSVGALTAQSGSTVSPGATPGSVATLTVNGALNLAAGSTLAIDINSTANDRVTATGAAITAGNLNLTVTGLPFTTFNQSFTLVSGASRTGTFTTGSLGNFGQAFAPVLVYDTTSVSLRLAPNSLVTLGGNNISGNALAVAGAFDTAVRGGYNPQPFFNLYTQGANLPAALSQLSGEVHSAERRVLLDDTRVVREAAFDRLKAGLSAIAGTQSVTSENQGKATTFWLRAAGSWGRARADGLGSSFTTEQRGVLTGIDFAANGFKIGGMFHFTHTELNVGSLGRSTVESTGGAVYGGYRQEGSGFAIGVGGSIASNRAESLRSITAPGLVQSLTSNVDGNSYQVFGEIAFDLVKADNIRIEPFARAAYAKVNSKAFAETGGFAGVTGIDQSSDATLTTLGMRAAYTTGMATLSGSAGWQRTTGDRSAASVLVIPGVNTPYSVGTVALDRNAVALEAQASFALSQRISLGIGYSGVIGDNNTDHGARATLTIGF